MSTTETEEAIIKAYNEARGCLNDISEFHSHADDDSRTHIYRSFFYNVQKILEKGREEKFGK